MGNSRSFQPPTNNNSLPNIRINNTDSSISTSTTTYDDEKTDIAYRQSISSLPISSKKPSIRPAELKSPKGSISFTQGLTNNTNTHHQHNHRNNSKNKLPPLSNKPTSLSTPPSLDTLSSLDQSSSNKLGLRQTISSDSFHTNSSSNTSSYSTSKPIHDSNNNTLKVNDCSKQKDASSIQFGRRTSSTQALNSLAKSPTSVASSSPKNFKQPSPSVLSNNNNIENNKNGNNTTPTIPSSPSNNTPTLNSPTSLNMNSDNGPNSSALLGPLPILNNSRIADESEDEESETPNKLISTNSLSLITSNKRVGAKLMFDRDAVNNSNVNKFDDCDTGSEVSRQEDEQPIFLSSNLDVDMMMSKNKKLAAISTPPRSHTALPSSMESPDMLLETPPQRKASLKNISSAPNLLYDSLSRKTEGNDAGFSIRDSLTMEKSASNNIDRKKKSSAESDDILDDILNEKPTLKSLKKLKSENSVRRRAGSLNSSKVKKSTEKNSSYLRENDGISSNILNILKGCEDLLGDLALEPKCPCDIEVTQPDSTPETSHLLPLQNSRRFTLLTVPDPKQVMRESRSEQKQHERKQKNVNKEVANIIKDIRSSFSEFDF